MNKKIIVPIIIIVIPVLIIIGNGILSTNWTTAAIEVVGKGYDEDAKEAYIITLPPNSSNEYYERKIVVEEPSVWNLIEEEVVYGIRYVQKRDKNVLTRINIFGDQEAIY